MFPVDWQDVKASCLNEPSDGASSLSVHKVLEIAGALFLFGFHQTLALIFGETFITEVYLLGFCPCCGFLFFLHLCTVHGV